MYGNRKQRICKYICKRLWSDSATLKIDDEHASLSNQMRAQLCINAMAEAADPSLSD